MAPMESLVAASVISESYGVSRPVALLDEVAVVSLEWARFIAGQHEED